MKSEMEAKEDSPDFTLLPRSRNTIWLYMKGYLHRPTMILKFLTRWRNQKYLT